MKQKINIYLIFVLLAAVLWGTAGIFIRTLEATPLSQMQIVFTRALFASLLLAVIIGVKDKNLFKIKIKDLWLFIATGLFSIVLFNFSYYMTISLTSLSVAAVLMYTAPFFVVIISVPLFKEKLNLKKSIACLIAFIGCCFVSGLFNSSQRISGAALFWGLLTGFGYSLYTIFGEVLIKRGYKSLTITFYVFLWAAICTAPFTKPLEIAGYMSAEPRIFVILILMAIVNTIMPFVLYTSGLTGVEPSTALIIATLEPVVATVFGAVIYSEKISLSGMLGIILVFSSVVILNMNSVKIRANAKINLTLGILGKRDDGYHLIDTIMQSVSLSDTVKISKSKKIKATYSNKNIDKTNNMALKAAKAFFEAADVRGGANIKIKNRIPTSSGMGGGSADAAAVLMGLNKLYETDLSAEELEKIALPLGADVPFFIKGGTQRAEGIGEILIPLTPLEKGYFILAKADTKPSTGEMYKQLDSKTPPLPETEKAIFAIENQDSDALSRLLVNSFTSVWGESKLQKRLTVTKADGVSLSGSGPTWFAYFKDKETAKAELKALKHEKITCFLATPQKNAIIFE